MRNQVVDTNVYLIGAVYLDSAECHIFQRLGWEIPGDYGYEVVISEELIEQISRVAKRLKNKDWAGEIIGRIWQKLKVSYVQIDDSTLATIEAQGIIPREDVGVYLTAKEGQAQCFVSANLLHYYRHFCNLLTSNKSSYLHYICLMINLLHRRDRNAHRRVRDYFSTV